MSWRHAAAKSPKIVKNTPLAKIAKKRVAAVTPFAPFAAAMLFTPFAPFALIRNGSHLARIERFEKMPGRLHVEFRVDCLDAEEEAVAAGEREPRHVEHRVVRHRQPVQRQH